MLVKYLIYIKCISAELRFQFLSQIFTFTSTNLIETARLRIALVIFHMYLWYNLV